MSDPIDIDEYRLIWHAAELECRSCRLLWLEAVRLADLVSEAIPCPSCGRPKGRVMHFEADAMRLKDALALARSWGAP